ncbi:hypothetical protein [Dyella amyloliquefaciens]|uniref:hypothetical protein n=1 Tax=Dyella amyloliquefaciens TaxID=1770545 RepID=UPI00102E7F67|nr:hypothetical protein [Dyella amyloliquefaciens]
MPSSRTNVPSTVAAITTGVLLFFLQMQFGTILNGSSLDSSWQEVLNWGITHHAQWGKDLVFTYGPLGFLGPDAPFDPALYPTWLSLQIVIALFLSGVVTAALRALPFPGALAYLVGTFVFGVIWSNASVWIVFYPLSMLILTKTAENPQRGNPDVLMVTLLSAFGSLLILVKFSAFPLWLLWLPMGTLVFLTYRARSLGVLFLAVGLLAPIAAWIGCGQNPLNIPSYIRLTWEVAVYYGQSMQGPPARVTEDIFALGSLLFVLVLTGIGTWVGRRSIGKVAFGVTVAATLVLAYRAGTLRADGGHLLIFWSISTWMCALAIGHWLQTSARTRAASFVGGLLILVPLGFMFAAHTYPAHSGQQLLRGTATIGRLKSSINQTLHFSEAYGQRLEAWRTRRASLSLPGIAARVGNSPTDLIMNDQGYLLANGLNYRPRPVFQGYSAYSDELSRVNEEFFLSDRAPDWVIANLGAIDGRYPNTDDAKALVRILQLYRPVFHEKQFLLFERDKNAPQPPIAPVPVATLQASFNKSVDLSAYADSPLLARFEVELTMWGKLNALLTREPPMYVEAEFRDGTIQKFRISRAVARSGFMLSPGLVDQQAYLAWLFGSAKRELVRLTLIQGHVFGGDAFALKSPLELSRLTLPRTAPEQEWLLSAYFPGFNVKPSELSQEPRRWEVNGQNVLNFQAPATITFDLPQGHYAVSAQFGLNEGATTDPTCLSAHPDGIGLSAYADGQDPQQGSMYLNPYALPHSALEATYSHQVSVQRGQRLRISINQGPPGSNGACDWAWIRDVHITPIPSH